MGPGFGIAAWAALAYSAWRLLRRGDLRVLLPLAFVALYFGFMGRQFTLYMRYFLPLYPALALLAGFGLVELMRGASELARRQRMPGIERAGYATVGLVLLLSLLAGAAYLHIYRQPVTRVEASRWLLRNLQPGTTVAIEHWDEGLPLQLPTEPPHQLRFAELPWYEVDSPQKMTAIIKTLDSADYVVISSNRLQNSIPRNVLSYPVSRHYYEMLDDGRLGFRKLREFTSYPSMLGISFPDAGQQESWSSYDHPRVQVYQKTPAYTHQRAEQLLLTGPAGVPALPKDAGKHGLLMSESMRETQVTNGTWTSVFSTSGLAKSQPTLLWLFVLEVAALAVTPIALVVFRGLPDRGYLLAKPLGLLMLAYPVWVLASLKIVHFDQTTIAAALLVLAIAGAWVANKQRMELGAFVREHWRLILFCEVMFVLAFLFFREIRLYNPDLWHPSRGGEKPMDLAYLTAVARSTVLPPYDPWFAGGYINYYYLGQYVTATMLKLTSIPPEVAYNLAVPTFFALTVAGAFSVTYNLAEASRRLLRRAPDGTRLPRWSAYAAGVLGVFLVAFAGNLDGLAQLTDRLQLVSHTTVESPIPLVAPVLNSLGGLYQVVFKGADLAAFDFWRSSRMLGPTISITEFPYFSFLFADLHAHMMSFAFAILSIGLGLALANGRFGERGSWREWTLVALLAWVVGALRVLNSWDYPPFLLLGLAAVAISERRLEGGAWPATQRLAAKAVVVVGLSFAFWWPFLRDYHTPVAGLSATPETTPLRQYLAHFAVVAAAVVGWLAYLMVRALRASPLADGRWQRAARRDETWLALAIIFGGGVPLVSIALVIMGHGLIGALLPVLAIVVYLALREVRARRPDGALRLFVLSMVGLALGLSIGVDLVVLDGDIQRMNTVFKFYLHVWILLALASSFGAWHLIFVAWSAARRPIPRVVATVGSVALAGFVLAGLVYPIGATPVRLDDRFRDLPKTLDGMAYMRDLTYEDQQGKISFEDDYQGIQWLRQNLEGTPAIVEAHAPIYRWGSRFAIYTGLPDVLGWDWHQTQQRGAGPVTQRAADVDQFYASPDVQSAVKFLHAYDVGYVIVGQVERLYYPPVGIEKFANGLNGALEPVYTNPSLTIYKVRPAP